MKQVDACSIVTRRLSDETQNHRLCAQDCCQACARLSLGCCNTAAADHRRLCPADSSAAVKQVRTDQPAQRLPTQIEAAPANPRPNIPVGGNGPVYNGNGCPEGTILIMFDMPIYDDEGLFVVGHEPTPMCIDEDTQPAG